MYSNVHHRVSKVFYNRQCLEVRVRNLGLLRIRHTYTKPVLEYQYYTEPLLVIHQCIQQLYINVLKSSYCIIYLSFTY